MFHRLLTVFGAPRRLVDQETRQTFCCIFMLFAFVLSQLLHVYVFKFIAYCLQKNSFSRQKRKKTHRKTTIYSTSQQAKHRPPADKNDFLTAAKTRQSSTAGTQPRQNFVFTQKRQHRINRRRLRRATNRHTQRHTKLSHFDIFRRAKRLKQRMNVRRCPCV